jgi:cysteine synthase
MKHENILGTVGNTPAVRINHLAPAGINLYVKIEAFNPLGSVKDRLALGVIEDAEQRGTLKPGQTVIEATSGNTGIGLAMVCAAKGYPLVVTMAETFSIEKNGWFLTRQFTNEANADMHSRTTAQEILRDFEGESLDYWVTGFGTGGTLKGVSRVLAEKRPETKIILCEPDAAPMVSSGIPQPSNPDGSPSASHPSWTPHPQQGWSPDFIPKLAQDAVDTRRIHQILRITNPEAMTQSQALAKKEGIFVGISSGATFAGALRIAAEAPKGSTILAMLPDTGERYLSTPLFAEVPVDMTPEELELSRSTPSAQLPPPQA